MITDTDLFIFVDNNSDLFDIAKMCKVLNLTRSSYYNFLKTETSNSEIKKQSIKELIKKIWWDSFKRYGAPKITIVLKKHYNIQISQKNSSKIHERVKYQRDFSTTTINEKWVSDTTYVYTKECGWCYLATILDLHSKRLIGWKFDKRMTSELVQAALENAIQTRKLNKVIVIHSDRGRQYTAEVYRNYCSANDFNLSYSEKGCPYDNAPM